MDITTEDEFAKALAKAQAAAAAYYDTSELLMSDYEYDKLIDAVAAAQERYGWDSGTILTSVAGGQSSGGDIEHPSPMGSLEKVHELDELRQWCTTINGPLVVEPKLDGMAIRAVYLGGKLKQVITRGDGYSGEDVTVAAMATRGLPGQLGAPVDLEIRGEVYMTDHDFEVSNAGRVGSGKPPFANPRNAVAGTLRNTKADYSTAMSFACYGTWPEDALSADHRETVQALRKWGVSTAAELWPSKPAATPAAVAKEVERLGKDRDQLGFPIDGAVVKAQLQVDRDQAGHGTKAPKWAMAYKYAPAEATSTLRGIEVSVGRTGRITLRAVIDPVEVAGTTITYATLHNPSFVTGQGLGIGSKVMVVRAGDVIPRVTAAVGGAPGAVAPWNPPKVCPQCDQPWNKDSLLWKCTTPECSIVEQITYAVSRPCLDVDGLSEAACSALVQEGKVSDIADLFSLTVRDIEETCLGVTAAGTPRRIGNANARKIAARIIQARSLPTDRYIAALGLGGVGPTLARRIARSYPTLEELTAATQQGLELVEGIGAEKAESIMRSLDARKATIGKLTQMGLGAKASPHGQPPGGEQSLDGMRIAVSGAMDGPLSTYNREQVRQLIEEHGGTSVSSVTTKTTHLVTKEASTSKAIAARELGVKVISPRQLASLLGLS